MQISSTRQLAYFLSSATAFIALLSSLLAQQEIVEKTISIPPGQSYTQSLNNTGEPTRLEVSVSSNSPVSLQAMTLQAHTLIKAGLEAEEGIVMERILEESGNISGEFTADRGIWWIHVVNQANYPNQITLKVATSDGKSSNNTPPAQPGAATDPSSEPESTPALTDPLDTQASDPFAPSQELADPFS